MRVAKEAIHISHISGCDRPIHTSLRAETIVDRIKKKKKEKKTKEKDEANRPVTVP